MKKEYIFIIIVIVIALSIFLILHFRRKEIKVEIKDVVSFHYSYSNGYMMNANIMYDYYYDKENDKYIVSVKPYLVAEEEKVEKEAPKELGEKIKEILIKYDLGKWNGFKKYAKDVLDGDGFSFHVRMVDDREIEADGYMMWPESYREVQGEYDNLFMKIYNEEKGIKEDE